MRDLKLDELLKRAKVPLLLAIAEDDDYDWRRALKNMLGRHRSKMADPLVWALERAQPQGDGWTSVEPDDAYRKFAAEVADAEVADGTLRLHYACACAGWRPSQLETASAFAALALGMHEVHREVRRRHAMSPDLDDLDTLVDRLLFSARRCTESALGWSALASGARVSDLHDAPLQVHAWALGGRLAALNLPPMVTPAQPDRTAPEREEDPRDGTHLDQVELAALREPRLLQSVAARIARLGSAQDRPELLLLDDLAYMPESDGLEGQLMAWRGALEERDDVLVRVGSEALLRDLPGDAAWYVWGALALYGDVAAQRELAAGFADLAAAIADDVAALENRNLGSDGARLLEVMRLTVERDLGLAAGWAAVSSGRRNRGRVPEALYAHAHFFAAQTTVMAWATQRDELYRTAYQAALAAVGREIRDANAPSVAAAVETGMAELEAIASQPLDGEPPTAIVVPAGTRGPERGDKIRIAGERLPLVVADPNASPWDDLCARFPHCADVFNTLQREIAPGRPLRLRPTLLVGEPGSGKSSLARAVLDGLGIPFTVVDAATCADQALTGSPRRWSNSYPSLPVTLCEAHGVANPGILVDEVEKAGRSSAGSLHDPLLSLLERKTAERWRDQCLEAEVDLSHVSWLFTANGLAGLPAPLLSRLRVLKVPLPERRHVAVLARQLLGEILAERGTDPVFEPALDGFELEAIEAAFGDRGSLRALRRFVEAVLDARHAPQVRN